MSNTTTDKANAWQEKERRLEAQLKQAAEEPPRLLMIPSSKAAKDFARQVTDPIQLRQSLESLAFFFRCLPRPDKEGDDAEERQWQQTLAPRLVVVLERLVARGDLLAALLHALCRKLLSPVKKRRGDEARKNAAAARERLATDPLVRLTGELFDSDDVVRARALDAIHTERPLPLLFALLELLDHVLEHHPGTAVFTHRARARILLALHAFGADAVQCLVKERQPRGELLFCGGLLLGLLEQAELAQLVQKSSKADRGLVVLAELLGASGRTDAFDQLLGLLVGAGDDDPLVAGKLAEVLYRTRPGPKQRLRELPEDTPPERVLELARSTWLPPLARKALIQWSASRGQAMLQLLDSAPPHERNLVFDALVELLAEPDRDLSKEQELCEALTSPLLEAARQQPRPEAIQTLSRVGLRLASWRSGVIALLGELLTVMDSDVEISIAAIEACVALKAVEHLESIRAIAESGDGERQAAAVEALSHLGGAADPGRLVRLASDPDPSVRRRAVAAMESLNLEPVARVAEALFDPAAGAKVKAVPAEQHELLGQLLASVLLSWEHQPAPMPVRAALSMASHLMGHPALDHVRPAGSDLASWLVSWFWEVTDLELRVAGIELLRILSPNRDTTPLDAELAASCIRALERGELTPEVLEAVLNGAWATRPSLETRRELAAALVKQLTPRKTRKKALALLRQLRELVFPFLVGQLDALGKKVQRELLSGLDAEAVMRALDDPALADDPEVLAGLCDILGRQNQVEHLVRPVTAFILIHGRRTLPHVIRKAKGEAAMLQILERLIQAIRSPDELEALLEALLPALAGATLGPALPRLLASGLPETPATPEILLLLLQGQLLCGGGHEERWGTVWRAVGITARVHERLFRLANGDAESLLEVMPFLVVKDLVLWLLGRDVSQVPMLACLEQLAPRISEELGAAGLTELLGVAMRYVDSPKKPVAERAHKIVQQVRAMLPPGAANAGPYRGAGPSVNLQAVDQTLARLAEQQREEAQRAEQQREEAEIRKLKHRLGRIGRARSNELAQLLEALAKREAVWALPALAEQYERDPKDCEELFEPTLEHLAEALERQGDQLVCLDCVARFEPRRIKTGLLSRVHYQACARCGQVERFVPGVERVVLEISDDVDPPYHCLESGELRVRWHQHLPVDASTVDQVVVRTQDTRLLDALVSWWESQEGRKDHRPAISIETPLDAARVKSLERFFGAKRA